jgi:heptaprenylglyceryl phosphate synthase
MLVAAPIIKSSGLEVISTGYMLIESGKLTSVVYMSNTTPIPSDKVDIALCTAMAGEMLGLKLIYMDAGSGANKPVPENTIRHVKKNISIPLDCWRRDQMHANCKGSLAGWCRYRCGRKCTGKSTRLFG